MLLVFIIIVLIIIIIIIIIIIAVMLICLVYFREDLFMFCYSTSFVLTCFLVGVYVAYCFA